MTSNVNRINTLPEFVELRARLICSDAPEENRFIKIDLRIQACEIEDADGCTVAKVSLSRAVLSMSLDGLEVAGGTRFGEPVKQNGLSVKTALKETTAATNKIAANATLGATLATPPEASFKAEAGGSQEKTTSITREVNLEEQHIYVKARGNDTWEITEPNGGKLDGTYLNDEKLCEFIVRRGANQLGVSTAIEVRQRDLEYDFTKSNALSLMTNNKKKLAGVLLAKSLASGQSEYAGKIVVSSSEDQYD